MNDGGLFHSALSRLLFAGNYRAVLRSTIDSTRGACEAEETPLVVGALVFSGRQDEALALHRWWTREHGDDCTVHVASQFFLSVGECRSGRYPSAIACCRDAARAAERTNPLHGFFVHQAIGLLRHFTGRSAAAIRHASRSRQLAVEAKFPYGRMLALDLLGHTLTLSGQVHAGIAVLEQSAELAESLGLVENAGAPRTASAMYRARYGIDSRRELQEITATLRPEDAYARRMVFSDLATLNALHGEGTLARERLDEAARIALPDGDRRARIRWLVAESVAAGFARGQTAAQDKLAAARALLDTTLDDALNVEILWAQALTSGLDAFDADETARARAESLAKRTAIGRATFLAAAPEARRSLEAIADDRMASLLALIQHDRDEARHRVTSQGIWGLLPMLHGFSPGRRIYLLHDLSLLVLEEQGNVAPVEMPGAVLVSLLCALAGGPVAKEELVRRVWKIKIYRPERHDALVHTAASRLRNALGPWGSWVRLTEAGYALAEGVTIHDDRPPEADEMIAAARVDAEPSTLPKRKGPEDRRAAVLEVLARARALSTSELADELKISEMTAYRLLTTMTGEGLLERTGQGKRTRYKTRA